jgi:TPR repeat protein
LSASDGACGKSVHFLPQNRRSDYCNKARGEPSIRLGKDRMNGTARDIAGVFKFADSESCPQMPELLGPRSFKFRWRIALEGGLPFRTLRDTKQMPKLALMKLSGIALAAALTVLATAPVALALDPNSGASNSAGPFDLFRHGFKAYREGKKEEAVTAYRNAAELGHTGSRWALATMYADGDGVVKNDFEAFKIYAEIASQGVEPGSNDTGFFVNALMSLAGYYYRGIPASPVRPDLSTARQLYFQAASTFGNADAQYRLAKMLLAGEGGDVNIKQAKKWLNHARREGHPGAMAVFGNVIFQEGQTVRGLAYMTAALDNCSPSDREWLQPLQEQAFSIVSEEERRTALTLATNIRKGGE